MKFFSNLKVSSKLTLAFGIVTFILVAICFTAVYALRTIDDKGNDLANSIRLSDALNEAKYNITWDKQLIMEILASETKTDVLAQVEGYRTANKGFDDNIKVLQ